MKQLIDVTEFLQESARLGTVVALARRLPDYVFLKPASSIAFVEADILWTEDWLGRMRSLGRSSEATLWFAVLEPHPLDYYWRNFSTVPVLRIDPPDSLSDVLDLARQDPGGSPADAFQYRSELLCVYLDDLRCVLYCDRALDLGILAAFDGPTNQMLADAFTGLTFSRDEAIAKILAPNLDRDIGGTFVDSFVENFPQQQ